MYIFLNVFLSACSEQKEDTSISQPIEEPATWVDMSIEVEEIRAQYNLPALGGVHIQDGVIAKLGTSGLRSSASEQAVTDYDKWHLGSCTKAMTATLAATYVDDGLLTWDSTLKELFPEIPMHPSYEDVTIAMLLSHHGGTWSSLAAHPETWSAMWQDGNVVEQRFRMVEDVLAEEPEVQPDSTFLYSNAGYIIVGVALEGLTDQSWEELMEERIFAPLGMNSCGFGGQDPDASLEHPWGHQANGEPNHPVDDFSDNPPALGPAGTVHCNLPDWSQFIIESLKMHRGESTLLSPTQAEKIFTVYGENYSLGWLVVERGWAQGESFTHTGSNTINHAVVWGGPAINEAYLAVTNIYNDNSAAALDALVVGLLP